MSEGGLCLILPNGDLRLMEIQPFASSKKCILFLCEDMGSSLNELREVMGEDCYVVKRACFDMIVGPDGWGWCCPLLLGACSVLMYCISFSCPGAMGGWIGLVLMLYFCCLKLFVGRLACALVLSCFKEEYCHRLMMAGACCGKRASLRAVLLRFTIACCFGVKGLPGTTLGFWCSPSPFLLPPENRGSLEQQSLYMIFTRLFYHHFAVLREEGRLMRRLEQLLWRMRPDVWADIEDYGPWRNVQLQSPTFLLERDGCRHNKGDHLSSCLVSLIDSSELDMIVEKYVMTSSGGRRSSRGFGGRKAGVAIRVTRDPISSRSVIKEWTSTDPPNNRSVIKQDIRDEEAFRPPFNFSARKNCAEEGHSSVESS
nr:hypothetical protein Iba_chr13dCG11640 [Ipomoea batatas]